MRQVFLPVFCSYTHGIGLLRVEKGRGKAPGPLVLIKSYWPKTPLTVTAPLMMSAFSFSISAFRSAGTLSSKL